MSILTISQWGMAQSTRLQVGVNAANVSVNNDGTTNKANTLNSLNIGLIRSSRSAGPIHFETGAMLSGKGSRQEIYYSGSTTDFYTKRSINPFYLEVPAHLVLNIPVAPLSKIQFYAGPYVAVGLFGKVKGESKFAGISNSFSNDVEFNNDNPFTSEQENASGSRLRRFDTGINAGAGVSFSKLNVRLNYGHGLSKIGSVESNTNDNNKHRVFSLNLGFKLL